MATSDARPTQPPARFAWLVVVGLMILAAAWLLGPHRDGTGAFDRRVADHFGTLAAENHGWRVLWNVLSHLSSPTTWRVLAAVTLLVLVAGRHTRGRSRSRLVATAWSVAVLLGGLVPSMLKLLVDRSRPPWAAVGAFGSSFPSGHAFGVTVFGVGALLALGFLAPPADRRGRAVRRALAVGVLAVVVLVCFARVALAVHYVTDVAAGVGLGLAYAGGWAWWVAVLDRRVAARRC